MLFISDLSCASNQAPFRSFIDLMLQCSNVKQSVIEKHEIIGLAHEIDINVKSPSDWINLESLGNMSAIKAKKLVCVVEKLLSHSKGKVIDLFIYTVKYFSQDNIYLLKILST